MNKLIISNLLRQDLRYKNIYEPEKDQLINYLSNSVSDNKIKVKYIKDKYGRSNPEKSYGLYNIRREIRQTVTKDYYMDIDIENAHPVILHEILKYNDIKCNHLTNYINNRKYYLEKVMNTYSIKRDDAKTLFIRILYGGSYSEWLEENKFKEFIQEISDLNHSMWSINKKIVEANSDLHKWVLDKHENDEIKKKNYNSSVVAYLLQEKEVQILEQLYIYSVDKGYIKNNDVVLCADGLMIPKENYNDNILNEYEKLIFDKFDIKLKFTNKKMNEYYNDDIIYNSLDIPELKIIDNEINLINQQEIIINDIIDNEIIINDIIDNELKEIENEILKLQQLNIIDNDKSINKLNKRKEKILKDKQKEDEKKQKDKQKEDEKKQKDKQKEDEKKQKQIDKLLNNKDKLINNYIDKINNEIEKKKKITMKISIKEQKIIDKIDAKKKIINKSTDFTPDTKYINIFSKKYMNSLSSYVDMKIYFEKFVCKILRPSCVFLYLEHHKDMCKEQCFFSEREIITSFREYKSGIYDSFGKEIPFINIWLDDPNILCYNKSDFIPYNGITMNQNNETLYNLFNGYNEKIKTEYNIDKTEKILSPFLDLAYTICGENKDHTNYFIKFIAHMIQKPNEKIPICFILKGKQGTGKNMLLMAISNIIGKDYYITSSKPKDFFGDFAEGFYRKLLVNMNECEGKDTFDFEGKIKSFITEDTININPKYIRPTEIRNIARIIITTNKPNPIPIDVKSIDRRFVVFQGSEKYLDKKYSFNYWEKLNNHFNCNEFISCLYNYLNTININDTNWKKERPITEAYKEICRLYAPVEALFLEDYIYKNKFVFDENELDIEINNNKEQIIKGEDKVKLNKLCDEYNKFCKKNGFIKDEISNISIKKFRSLIESLEVPIKIYKTMGLNYCKFNYNDVIKFLKDKKYIERDDDEAEEIEEIYEEENFDDMFNI
jgi:hypothetical protein